MEQQQELRMAMADLLLKFAGGTNFSPSRDNKRSVENEFKVDR
jgi:hypothetical protein